MSSVDSTAISSTPVVNPAVAASAKPSGSAAPPPVTPAAAAACPANSLLCGTPLSILPFAQAASLVDWLDVMLQAHPYLAPLFYIGVAYGLQRYNDGTAIGGYGQGMMTRWSPHQLQMVGVIVFACALAGLKTIHSRGLQWIPTSIKFLVGSDFSGLSSITPFISRFYFTMAISYPLIAWGTLSIFPNQKPVQGACIAAAVMMLPLLIALGKNLMGEKKSAVPAATSVG